MAKRVPPLTAVQISNLKPGPKAIELVDGAVPGLRLRVLPTGRRSWSLNIRDAKGAMRRFTLGDGIGLADARKKAEELRRGVKEGDDPTAAKRAARGRAKDAAGGIGTLGAVVDSYFTTGPGAGHRTRTEQINRIKSVFGKQLDQPSPDVTQAGLQLAADAWPAKGSAAGAVKYLRPVLRWAHKRALMPVKIELEKPSLVGEPKQRVLSEDELRAILPHLKNEPYARASKLLLFTAVRLRELTEATWGEFDLEAKVWTIPGLRRKDVRSAGTRRITAAKNHVIPLSRQAVALLKELRAERDDLTEALGPIKDTDLVFFGPRGAGLGNWDRGMKRLRKLTGVDDWSPHALRRTAATSAGGLGVPPHVLGAILGHATVGSALLSRYVKTTYTAQHALALQQLADYYDGLETKAAKVIPMKR
jgi:integrase